MTVIFADKVTFAREVGRKAKIWLSEYRITQKCNNITPMHESHDIKRDPLSIQQMLSLYPIVYIFSRKTPKATKSSLNPIYPYIHFHYIYYIHARIYRGGCAPPPQLFMRFSRMFENYLSIFKIYILIMSKDRKNIIKELNGSSIC